jgi:dipeptidyl aminopeptidase/acylaminoacyl peptidase
LRQLTAEDVATYEIPHQLRISPDGRSIVYSLRSGWSDGRPLSAIWLVPLDGCVRPKQLTSGDASDFDPQWSPDGRTIAFLSDAGRPGVAGLYQLDLDNNRVAPLDQSIHSTPVVEFAWSPAGNQIAFTRADDPSDAAWRRVAVGLDAREYSAGWRSARLHLLQVPNGEIRAITPPDTHITAFAWAPNADELCYVIPIDSSTSETGVASTWIERVALTGGARQLVCTWTGTVIELLWSGDGQHLLFMATLSESQLSSRGVFRVAVSGGVPKHLALGTLTCARGIVQPPRGPRSVVAQACGLGTRLCWLDPITGESEVLYPDDSQCGEAGEDIAAWAIGSDFDQTLLAVVRGAGRAPWEIWTGPPNHRWSSRDLRQVTNHSAQLSTVEFGQQVPFQWSTVDHSNLDGMVIYPPNDPMSAPSPMIVLVHPGPYGRWNAGFQLGWRNWAQWLAAAGYRVLLPNPRGGLGHGERFAAAVRGTVGGPDYQDIMLAIDVAIQSGIADPNHLAIAGWSHGGYIAAWAITQTHRFRAAIVGAGVTEWGSMVISSDMPEFQRELCGGAPWDGPGPHLYAMRSPISYASRVRTPVLLLHGEEDTRVPVSQAVGFYRALRQHRIPCELVVYPRESHEINEPAHRVDLLERVLAWYERWIL